MMRRMPILLMSFVVSLLILTTNVFASEQTEKRRLLIKVSVLEIKKTALPRPAEKSLAALEINILEGESRGASFGRKPIGKGNKKIDFYGSSIQIETGKIVESTKGAVTVNKVHLVFKINLSKIIVFDLENNISQINASSMDLDKVFALDKKERFQWGESGDKIVEIMVSGIK